jgi:AraC-like DNA-binding protein
MDSLIDMFLLRQFSILDWLKTTKCTRDGCIELTPRRSYGEGTCLLKPICKTVAVNTGSLTYRQSFEHIIKDEPGYFFIGLSEGTTRSIFGAHIVEGEVYRRHCNAGYCHSGVGVTFLPEFFDTLLNSRHGISQDELIRAFNALRDFPSLPDAAILLKQIGEASFTGDIERLWIEGKILELVASVLDWYRRRETKARPRLNENDQTGITEAMRYADEHCSGPLTLDILAKQAAMSISKFTAVFKIHTGISVASYIRRIRMEKAMNMLKNTSAPLGDIAGMVGYKYQRRFSTLFKEQFGVAPSEFRKRE